MSIIITSKWEQYSVLPLTFKVTSGIQKCELWKERNVPWSYAIGEGHCPPLHCTFEGYAKVDFDKLNAEKVGTTN